MANNGNIDEGESEATLQSNITASKQRYENIRTLFSRYLKRIKPPSGSDSDQVVLDQRYEHLRWLITFIRTRSTTGNNTSLKRQTQEQTCLDAEELELEFPPDKNAAEERSSNEEDSQPRSIDSQIQQPSSSRWVKCWVTMYPLQIATEMKKNSSIHIESISLSHT